MLRSQVAFTGDRLVLKATKFGLVREEMVIQLDDVHIWLTNCIYPYVISSIHARSLDSLEESTQCQNELSRSKYKGI
jgi:hypothetical protein